MTNPNGDPFLYYYQQARDKQEEAGAREAHRQQEVAEFNHKIQYFASLYAGTMKRLGLYPLLAYHSDNSDYSASCELLKYNDQPLHGWEIGNKSAVLIMHPDIHTGIWRYAVAKKGIHTQHCQSGHNHHPNTPFTEREFGGGKFFAMNQFQIGEQQLDQEATWHQEAAFMALKYNRQP